MIALYQRDNQSRTYFFIKNNEKPRKHCVCEVFFLPEKHAENCSKTDGSTRTAPIQHPLIYDALKSDIPHRTVQKSYEGFFYEAEIINVSSMKIKQTREV